MIGRTKRLLLAGTYLLLFFGSAAAGYSRAVVSYSDENCDPPVDFCDECENGVAQCVKIISEWKCEYIDNVEFCECKQRFGRRWEERDICGS